MNLTAGPSEKSSTWAIQVSGRDLGTLLDSETIVITPVKTVNIQ